MTGKVVDKASDSSKYRIDLDLGKKSKNTQRSIRGKNDFLEDPTKPIRGLPKSKAKQSEITDISRPQKQSDVSKLLESSSDTRKSLSDSDLITNTRHYKTLTGLIEALYYKIPLNNYCNYASRIYASREPQVIINYLKDTDNPSIKLMEKTIHRAIRLIELKGCAEIMQPTAAYDALRESTGLDILTKNHNGMLKTVHKGLFIPSLEMAQDLELQKDQKGINKDDEETLKFFKSSLEAADKGTISGLPMVFNAIKNFPVKELTDLRLALDAAKAILDKENQDNLTDTINGIKNDSIDADGLEAIFLKQPEMKFLAFTYLIAQYITGDSNMIIQRTIRDSISDK